MGASWWVPTGSSAPTRCSRNAQKRQSQVRPAPLGVQPSKPARAGGASLGNDQEIDAIVAFLHTLTDARYEQSNAP